MNDKLRVTSQTFLPANFHNLTISSLFFIHKNKRVQFFLWNTVHTVTYHFIIQHLIQYSFISLTSKLYDYWLLYDTMRD